MIAAATAATGLVLACVILGLVVVVAWAAAESDHDRVERHRHRALLAEIRRHPDDDQRIRQLDEEYRQLHELIDRERRYWEGQL